MGRFAGLREGLLVAALLLSAGTAFAGPISPLYLSTGTNIYVRQGNAQIDTWATISPNEGALAVNSTVRTYSQGFGSVLSPLSHEYTLDGTSTGVVYENTVGCCFRDGTTDGTYNYAIRPYPGGLDDGLYQFDLDWTNPQLMLFGPPYGADTAVGSGIAYDVRTDSFWFVQNRLVFDVSRTGGLLNYFWLPADLGDDLFSLALDPADYTLWISRYAGGDNLLEQYSTEQYTLAEGLNPRTPLSSEQLDFFGVGAEFAFIANGPVTQVPEPSSLLLLLIGLAGTAMQRRKYRRFPRAQILK